MFRLQPVELPPFALFELFGQCRPIALDQSRGGDTSGDGAFDIAKGELRIAMAGPGGGLFEKVDFAGEVFEENAPEAVHVIVRDVAEGHGEAVVEALGEEGRRKILGDEAQQVIAEPCLVGGAAEFRRREFAVAERRRTQGVRDRSGTHGRVLSGLVVKAEDG